MLVRKDLPINDSENLLGRGFTFRRLWWFWNGLWF